MGMKQIYGIGEHQIIVNQIMRLGHCDHRRGYPYDKFRDELL